MELKQGPLQIPDFVFKLHYLKTQFITQAMNMSLDFCFRPLPSQKHCDPRLQGRLAPSWVAAETSKVPKTGLQMFSQTVQLLQQLVRSALFSNSLMFYFHSWEWLLINQVQGVCFSLSKKEERKNWIRNCWVIQKQPELKDMRNVAERWQ